MPYSNRLHARVVVAAAAAAALAISIGATVLAGDPSPPLDESTLEQIDALIPPASPGEYDPAVAEELFTELGDVLGNTQLAGSGSSLTGVCGGFAFSYDADGERIDAAYDSGTDAAPIDLLEGTQAFTSGNPFKVDTQGTVVYYGFMPIAGDGPRDHSWRVEIAGVSVDTGGDPNTSGKNRNTGMIDLGEDLPFAFSAKTEVSGRLTSSNIGPCVGSGHVDLEAPFANPVTIGSIVLLGGGLLGMLFNARPARTWRR